MDLQQYPDFQALDVALVSIAFDPATEQAAVIDDYGIPPNVPMLVDADGAVSRAYDVLKWAVRTGEPGHTFVLVDENGKIVWIKDYGSPDLPNPVMYVDPAELVDYIRRNLD